MKNSLYYWISILFAVVALILHISSRGQMEAGHRITKQRGAEAQKQNINFGGDIKAHQLFASGRLLRTVGLISSCCGFVTLMAAVFRQEQGFYSIPIILLLFGITIGFLF